MASLHNASAGIMQRGHENNPENLVFLAFPDFFSG
jgi:hypothetical protein